MTTIGATCPSCEFSHGMPGKAVAFKDGLMRCESCGSTWREMGGNAPAPSARAAVRRDLAIPSAPRATILAAVSDATAPSRRRLAAGDGIIWLAAAVAAFSLLAQPFWLMGQWRQLDIASLLPGSRKQIEISMLSASQLENDGRIAVRIEGRIVNRSDRRQPVGDVDITLSQEQGHTVYRWKHRPAVTYLEPGQSIRFSTANGEVPAAASSVEVRSAGSHSVARL